MIKKIYLFTLLLVCFLCAQPVQAANRFNSFIFKPAPVAGHFYAVSDASLLAEKEWVLGRSLEFGDKPIVAQVAGADVAILKRYIVEYYQGAFGLTDWLSFGLTVPVVWYGRITNPDTRVTTNEMGWGDVELMAKIALTNQNTKKWALVFVPFMTLPSGNAGYFFGDTTVTGGGNFVVGGLWGNKAHWALNVGTLFRERMNAYGLDFDEQLLLAGAVNYALTQRIAVYSELETRTPYTDFFGSANTSPTEFRTGLQLFLGKEKRFMINTGGSFGITHGGENPRYKVFSAMSYRIGS
ncbi:MAG: transporter [bacterium]